MHRRQNIVCLWFAVLASSFVLSAWSVGAQAPSSTPPPSAPEKPAGEVPPAPEQPVRKKPVAEPWHYTATFDAIRAKLPEAQWDSQRKPLTAREISKAMGDEIKKDDKAVIAQMIDGEVLGAQNFMDKQVCMVQILRFTDEENAKKYLDMAHRVSKVRFDELSKKQPGSTFEISDEKLQVIGVSASKRLVVKSLTGPRAGSTFINRFVKGQIFVEVTIVAKAAEKSVDMAITDEAIMAVGRS